jgi:hypothetical protein
MPFSPIEERFDGGEFFLELPGRPAPGSPTICCWSMGKKRGVVLW